MYEWNTDGYRLVTQMHIFKEVLLTVVYVCFRMFARQCSETYIYDSQNPCKLQEGLILLWYDNGGEIMGNEIKIGCNEDKEWGVVLCDTGPIQTNKQKTSQNSDICCALMQIRTKIKEIMYAGTLAFCFDSTESMPGRCLCIAAGNSWMSLSRKCNVSINILLNLNLNLNKHLSEPVLAYN